MYGSHLFDNHEDKLNFNSYKRCTDDNIVNTKLCVYHLGESQNKSNNLSLLKNPKDINYHSFQ